LCLIISSVSAEARTPTCGANARSMMFLGSSGFPCVALVGENVPFKVGCENTEPTGGVEAPELCRDRGSEAVEANMEERDGLGKRYGRSETEEVGDDLCLGRTIEPSDSAYWGRINVVASDEGVMNAPPLLASMRFGRVR